VGLFKLEGTLPVEIDSTFAQTILDSREVRLMRSLDSLVLNLEGVGSLKGKGAFRVEL
jgi:hypothetical protein